MSAPLLRDLARGLLDLVFAPVCVACEAPIATARADRLVCVACWSRMRPVPAPWCPRCGGPVRPLVPGQAPGACAVCAGLPPYVRAVRSSFLMQGPAREVVHALKYRGWRSVAAPMADRMAGMELPLEVTEEAALVVPVPLGPVRMRQRGYNQAELLGHRLAARRGWICRPEVLQRTAGGGTQTALHPAERRANVAGAFRVPAGAAAEVRREHVVVVDDVWTTGATALACCEALIQAGARAATVLTFARAVPEYQR